MNEVLARQLALDFCCTPEDVKDRRNHFNEYTRREGRRKYKETEACALKIAAVNGKLLFAGEKEILARCRELYGECGAEWFVEPGEMRRLDGVLQPFGYRVSFAHPFYICEKITPVDTKGLEIHFYEREEIERFRGDGRFGEAFSFCEDAPDVLGVSAVQDGAIIGMAGASADSPTMWQIGINIEEAHRGKGVGQMLTALLKNEILRRGVLPFYGTSFSHLSSQRVALGAGFVPAWVELSASKIEE